MAKKGTVRTTHAGKASAIHRINDRREQLRRAVEKGEIPRIYLQKYDESIQAVFRDPGMYTKSGRIARGKKVTEAVSEKDLEALLGKTTAGQAREQTRRSYEEEVRRRQQEAEDEYEDYEDDYDYDDYISDMDYVNAALAEDYTNTYSALSSAFRGTHGKKSYKQLRDAIDGHIDRPNNIDIERAYFT